MTNVTYSFCFLSIACKHAFCVTSSTSFPYEARSPHSPSTIYANEQIEVTVAAVHDIKLIALSRRMSPDGIAVKTVEGNTIAAFASRHSINANFTASVICF